MTTHPSISPRALLVWLALVFGGLAWAGPAAAAPAAPLTRAAAAGAPFAASSKGFWSTVDRFFSNRSYLAILGIVVVMLGYAMLYFGKSWR